ncbi:DUF3352 domain-containing protein, partial [Baaleninema sp.]|uniref:DUF3352 domain-containing protein n=1 Tax=Baaleninema sp. TaxID=3101197 RepID=UPI003D04C12E
MRRFLTLAFLTFGGISAGYAAESEPPEIVPPAVTQYLPANAAMVVLFRTDNTWSNLAQFAGVPENIDAPGILPFVPLAGEDFGGNLRSWAGEWAAFASLSLSSTPSEVPVNEITLVPLRDGEAFDRYLDRVRDSRSQPPETQTHNGVEFWVFPEENPSPPPRLEEMPSPEDSVILDPASEPPSSKAIEVYSNSFNFNSFNFNSFNSNSFNSNSFNSNSFNSNSFKDFKRSHRAQTLPPTLPDTPSETPTDDIPPVPFPSTPLYEPSLAIARLPGYVVFAASAEDLRGFLDLPNTVKPLAEVPAFQNILAHEAFDRSLIAVYGNFKQIAQQLKDLELSLSTPQVPTPDSEAFTNLVETYTQIYSTGEALIWTDESGVRSQMRVYYRQPQPETAADATNPNRLLDYIPATVYGSANGQKLGESVTLVLDAYSQIPPLAEFVTQLRRGVAENLGLELERDILQWMDGEFAFVAFPSNGGLFPSFTPEFKIATGILLETSDRPAAERFLAALDELVGRLGEGLVSIDTTDIAGEPFISWNAPFSVDGSFLTLPGLKARGFSVRWVPT